MSRNQAKLEQKAIELTPEVVRKVFQHGAHPVAIASYFASKCVKDYYITSHADRYKYILLLIRFLIQGAINFPGNEVIRVTNAAAADKLESLRNQVDEVVMKWLDLLNEYCRTLLVVTGEINGWDKVFKGLEVRLDDGTEQK